jgi:choline dehydrogenase-like flavoprotein
MSVKTYRDLTEDVVFEADVCVIGTGCGGSTLGARLAETGKRVVFIERGGYYTKENFDQREDNMIAKIDGGRGFDSSVDGSIALTYGNNVGGASVHYWADSYRTPDQRLNEWESQFGLSGHGVKELGAFWETLEKDHNVVEAAPQYYNRMNQLIRLGAEKLGWDGHPVPQARRPCAASGYCQQGCAYDFKQSQIVTHIPRALEAGATLFADTEAQKLNWSGGRVTDLDCAVLDRATGKPNGRKVKVKARAFVLAAGGYGSPVFLLKNGFKSKLPATGEYIHTNPSPIVHALFDEEIVLYRNIPAAYAVTQFRFAKLDGTRYVEGGYSLMANQLQPATLSAVLAQSGSKSRALMSQLKNIGGTISWIDDVEFGRVELKGDQPKFHFPIDGENGKRIRDAFRKQAQLLFAVGARELIFADLADTRLSDPALIEDTISRLDIRPGRFVFAAPHPSGGARMGNDPKNSVVGNDHRVHGTDNLFVADPSVFPTAPGVDPSLTIMAFSCVAAGHVEEMFS